MECGEEIRIKDFYGMYALRVIAQCHDRFLLISNSTDHRNGYLLTNWQQVLRELVALAVPAKLIEKTYSAESSAQGFYVNFPLTYPLSAQNFANLFHVDVADVREQLADLAVKVDG